ncbi:DUF4367 domain-containing protein [Bacillus sp. BGMRC 2118]|nr:DUF4367 domain-containing protein [Bacillus sp. BGMRC 2118]
MEGDLKNLRNIINTSLESEISLSESEKYRIISKMNENKRPKLKSYGAILATILIASILTISSNLEEEYIQSVNNLAEIELSEKSRGEQINQTDMTLRITANVQSEIEKLNKEGITPLIPRYLPVENVQLDYMKNINNEEIQSFYNSNKQTGEFLFSIIQINKSKEVVEMATFTKFDYSEEVDINGETAYFTKWDIGANELILVKDNVTFKVFSESLSKEELSMILKSL